MKIAVVTGAYGFLGRYVAREASMHGYTVIGLGHGAWDRNEWRNWGISEWHEVDINVENMSTYANEPDVIFHCAGSGSVAFSVKHPYKDHQRTVGTTLSVLEFIRLYSPTTKLVVPSSAGVYGAIERMPINVNDKLNPVSPYGLHKKQAEEISRSYATHFNLNIAIVRLFSVYGIGIRKQLLWDACIKISQGEMIFFGTGTETRDWLHVSDAATLMMKANQNTSNRCPVVNGGVGIATSNKQIVRMIADAMGTKNTPSFNGSVRAGDPIHYQAEIQEALEWGWRPSKDLAKEIELYVAWFLEGGK